jgi:hypothetical protein
MSRAQRRWGRKAYRRLRIRKGESRHHLRPRSRGGSDDLSNLSVVKQVDHDHFHAMFSNMLPPTICGLLNDKWLDPRWKFICVEVNKVQHEKQQMEEGTCPTGSV